MTEPVAATASVTEPAVLVREQWDPQIGENALWYARFLRFVALGPTRSVSLVAKGRRNAYPIPAHWPIQAKQHRWRERATAFDEAARNDPRVVDYFNTTLIIMTRDRLIGEDERMRLDGVMYIVPADDEA